MLPTFHIAMDTWARTHTSQRPLKYNCWNAWELWICTMNELFGWHFWARTGAFKFAQKFAVHLKDGHQSSGTNICRIHIDPLTFPISHSILTINFQLTHVRPACFPEMSINHYFPVSLPFGRNLPALYTSSLYLTLYFPLPWCISLLSSNY